MMRIVFCSVSGRRSARLYVNFPFYPLLVEKTPHIALDCLKAHFMYAQAMGLVAERRSLQPEVFPAFEYSPAAAKPYRPEQLESNKARLLTINKTLQEGLDQSRYRIDQLERNVSELKESLQALYQNAKAEIQPRTISPMGYTSHNPDYQYSTKEDSLEDRLNCTSRDCRDR